MGKKIILVVLFLVLTSFWTSSIDLQEGLAVEAIDMGQADTKENDKLVDSISDKIIRFHVIANSDSVEDQALKIKIRDRILSYISPKLKKSKTLDQSRQILKNEDKNIRAIAAQVIKENGFKYDVETELSYENFPVKSYGIITLPEGEYEAYRVLIGNAKGQNWWCVMFPPLCFIDVTKSDVSKEETEQEMKKVLNENEFRAITAEQSNLNSSGQNIKVKFKIVEVLNNLFKEE